MIVRRRWLYGIAGIVWGGVGVMLCVCAAGWLADESPGYAILITLAGVSSGALIYRFKFAKLADKNIKRIGYLRERESVLVFQSASTYILIVFMMGLGIALRHSALPRPLLAALYTGIGLGLLLAGLRYYHPFMWQHNKPESDQVRVGDI
ncbi:MAG: hypothetical protein JXQ72_07810 [Anaerolineae bacterium]|nr:hypothetical protein [Anaerolineae bacterium]